MAAAFRFSAQPEQLKHSEDLKGKPPDPVTSSKRARPDDASVSDRVRPAMGESFKSKLVNASNPNQWQGFGAGKDKLKIADGDITVTVGPTGPAMKLSDGLKTQLCRPWEKAVILKTMGRSHTLNFMHTKLKQKWNLHGNWQLTDLEDGYFVVRFQMEDDLEYVLTGGPWVVANHYITVQKWRPNFLPGEDVIQRMPVWVRLSKLPMEWIDVELLRSIGGMLGTTFKVDPITETQARGRYARICVEIDITKPLISSLLVEDREIKVEYESLGSICFKCGRVGHNKEVCREGIVEQNEGHKENNQSSTGDSTVREPYGPWLQVAYGRNGRQMGVGYTGRKINSQGYNGRSSFAGKTGADASSSAADNLRQSKGLGKNSVTNPRRAVITGRVGIDSNLGSKIGSGSRFDVLSEETATEDIGTSSYNRVDIRGNTLSKRVLAEISNRKAPNKNYQSSGPSKYLIKPPLVNPTFNKPFKENIRSEQAFPISGTPKNVEPAQSIEDDIEDSAVLQSLHKDILQQVQLDNSNGAAASTAISPPIQVNVSDATDFEMVASNLKEAMEVVLN